MIRWLLLLKPAARDDVILLINDNTDAWKVINDPDSSSLRGRLLKRVNYIQAWRPKQSKSQSKTPHWKNSNYEALKTAGMHHAFLSAYFPINSSILKWRKQKSLHKGRLYDVSLESGLFNGWLKIRYNHGKMPWGCIVLFQLLIETFCNGP